jgi:hypothetical protein
MKEEGISMHLDYDKLEVGSMIKRETLEPGDVQGQLNLTVPGLIDARSLVPQRPSDLSSAWKLVDPSMVDATISGHTHIHAGGVTINENGMTINAGNLATGMAVPNYASAKVYNNSSGNLLLTSQNVLQIQGSNGLPVVKFDLVKGTIDINQDTNIQVAAEIFWHAVSNSNKGLIPRSEFTRLNNTNAELRDELSRTQALLEKSLKALGDKYNEELAVSEDVEF